ncbi:5-deoxy-glucuronate isomerase [Corynebacterium callunae]|uniref:5-deoxy-glucuronate isomerase n=1 Tax=Corynebacterium callunae TaxID=1721 RepID=UPI0020004A28|nr:5-deoxy-glucuronate isomerase [Corynebacterium callunae]MCK2199583.1 5-deoxy-glucuronate isomerase [Corynebacterium callunae]
MSTTDERWFYKKGELARGPWQSMVDATTPGWEYTGIRIAELEAGMEIPLDETGVERIFIPLSGSFDVIHQDHETHLFGRKSVFDGPTDVLYLPTGTTAVVRGEGRIAVAEAPTQEPKEWKYIAPAETPVELRGAGRSSRQVHNFGTPAALDAARLIVCEVITPGENWSSYPPHKHDEYKPGHESKLEEIYYFESAPSRVGGRTESAEGAFGMFSTYSSPAGEIDINAMVYTGDIALVPYGYHGPAVAAPGYDLYYLNVMAGPDPERIWLINDDPAHAWVRDTWNGQAFDDRLPYEDKREG